MNLLGTLLFIALIFATLRLGIVLTGLSIDFFRDRKRRNKACRHSVVYCPNNKIFYCRRCGWVL